MVIFVSDTRNPDSLISIFTEGTFKFEAESAESLVFSVYPFSHMSNA